MREINPPEHDSPTPLAAILGCGLKILASIAGGTLVWWLAPLYWSAAQAITSTLPYLFLLPATLCFWGVCVLGTMHYSKEFSFLFKTWAATAIMLINAITLFVAYLMSIKNWNGILWQSCWLELVIAVLFVAHIGFMVIEPLELRSRFLRIKRAKKPTDDATESCVATEKACDQ